uniref:Uncharacterized protein n=1 Tax=Setaria italica TaxID=4555 RepID=K3ZL02_SETIT
VVQVEEDAAQRAREDVGAQQAAVVDDAAPCPADAAGRREVPRSEATEDARDHVVGKRRWVHGLRSPGNRRRCNRRSARPSCYCCSVGLGTEGFHPSDPLLRACAGQAACPGRPCSPSDVATTRSRRQMWMAGRRMLEGREAVAGGRGGGECCRPRRRRARRAAGVGSGGLEGYRGRIDSLNG